MFPRSQERRYHSHTPAHPKSKASKQVWSVQDALQAHRQFSPCRTSGASPDSRSCCESTEQWPGGLQAMPNASNVTGEWWPTEFRVSSKCESCCGVTQRAVGEFLVWCNQVALALIAMIDNSQQMPLNFILKFIGFIPVWAKSAILNPCWEHENLSDISTWNLH